MQAKVNELWQEYEEMKFNGTENSFVYDVVWELVQLRYILKGLQGG